MKKVLLILFLLLAAAASAANIYASDRVFLYGGNVISYCMFKGENGSKLLLVIKSAPFGERLPDGKRCGGYIYLLDGDTPYGLKKIIKRYDFRDIKPTKIMSGDVDGNGKDDISVIVYKKTKFHDVEAKRPFFYGTDGDVLYPLWLGSRLSHPFSDYVLLDIDNDGIHEIAAAEYLEDGKMNVAVYDWQSFGFVKNAESETYESIDTICVFEGKLFITSGGKSFVPAIKDK